MIFYKKLRKFHVRGMRSWLFGMLTVCIHPSHMKQASMLRYNWLEMAIITLMHRFYCLRNFNFSFQQWFFVQKSFFCTTERSRDGLQCCPTICLHFYEWFWTKTCISEWVIKQLCGAILMMSLPYGGAALNPWSPLFAMLNEFCL